MFVMELRTKTFNKTIEQKLPLFNSLNVDIVICIHALKHGHIFTVYVGRAQSGKERRY